MFERLEFSFLAAQKRGGGEGEVVVAVAATSITGARGDDKDVARCVKVVPPRVTPTLKTHAKSCIPKSAPTAAVGG